jgi:hypothetical protein
MSKGFGWSLVLVLGLVPAVWAQSSGGNVYGTVVDQSGAALPGATVTIASSELGGTRSTVTGSVGEFRFLNLDHATYKLTVTVQGFATVTRDVIVNTGVNVELNFNMKVAGLQEMIAVTAETPVVDVKKVGTSTTLTKDELSEVPQGRDPWAILKNVPGVLVDRVSIAGSEAGQQSLFVAKGAQQNDTMWNLDGIAITDTTSFGASSAYFDFDAFDEINVTTGGGDLKVASGGIGLNFVTKRGTNAFHGNVHLFGTNHKFGESSNTPSGIPSSSLLDGRADSIRQIADYGGDLGGPIIKDKLWFWGSYGKQDIRLYRFISQTNDRTLIKSINGKINWQADSNTMVSLFYFNGGEKSKYNRDPGQAGSEAASFFWNQGTFFATQDCGVPCGIHGLWKAEVNHTFGPNLFVNAKYAFYNWGYGFDPVGGSGQDASVDHVADTAKGSWVKTRFLKPWHTANLDGSYFFSGLNGRHEMKFGFGYKHWPNSSSISFSGNGIVAYHNNDDPNDPTSRVAWVTRPFVATFKGDNLSGYLGDTYTSGRLTLNAGVRWDQQKASNGASVAPGNPLFPDLLPTLKFDGNVPGIKWNDFSPRVGLTLALDDSRKTVARASYAHYAGQLASPDATFNSPIPYGYTYLAYKWVDRNGDGFAQKDEILTNQGVLYAGNVDPANTTSLVALNKLDPNYHANHDDEIIVGLEREVIPNFSVGVAYTWRKGRDYADWTPRIDANGNLLTPADFSANAPVSSNGYTVQTYSPNPARIGNNARVLTNRPNFNQTYNGIELTALKRLSNKWMLRAAFSYNDWKEHLTGPGAFQNPTPQDVENFGGLNSPIGNGPLIEGGIVANKSYGAKTNTFFNSKWQVTASGLYQLPAGFEVGASLLGRQGNPKALVLPTSAGADGSPRVVVGPLDLQRYASVWDLDLRLADTIKLGGSATFGITLDLFNALNADMILQVNRRANSGAFQQPLEVINPRVLRFGFRLAF